MITDCHKKVCTFFLENYGDHDCTSINYQLFPESVYISGENYDDHDVHQLITD